MICYKTVIIHIRKYNVFQVHHPFKKLPKETETYLNNIAVGLHPKTVWIIQLGISEKCGIFENNAM